MKNVVNRIDILARRLEIVSFSSYSRAQNRVAHCLVPDSFGFYYSSMFLSPNITIATIIHINPNRAASNIRTVCIARLTALVPRKPNFSTTSSRRITAHSWNHYDFSKRPIEVLASESPLWDMNNDRPVIWRKRRRRRAHTNTASSAS